MLPISVSMPKTPRITNHSVIGVTTTRTRHTKRGDVTTQSAFQITEFGLVGAFAVYALMRLAGIDPFSGILKPKAETQKTLMDQYPDYSWTQGPGGIWVGYGVTGTPGVPEYSPAGTYFASQQQAGIAQAAAYTSLFTGTTTAPAAVARNVRP